MKNIIIAIDAMGGDFGTRSVVPAAADILKKYPDVKLILVGDQYILNKQLKNHAIKIDQRLEILHAEEKVAMDESPLLALRKKKKSSMRLALNLVKEGQAHACVSAGNTGALLAIARFVLKTIPGVERPAIMRVLPTIIPDKNIRVLDLGANVDSEPEHLQQFAVMGSIVSTAVNGIKNPKVGLLNIGEEDIKGNALVKEASELLKKTPAINYTGYIEGDKVYTGTVDVIICDGFIGNVALKITEGSIKMMMKFLKEAFMRNWYSKLAGLMAMQVLKKLKKKIDPERYNGASLVGLQGIVIKSHGGANAKAFANAIEAAIEEVEKDIPKKIHHEVSQMLKQQEN